MMHTLRFRKSNIFFQQTETRIWHSVVFVQTWYKESMIYELPNNITVSNTKQDLNLLILSVGEGSEYSNTATG